MSDGGPNIFVPSIIWQTMDEQQVKTLIAAELQASLQGEGLVAKALAPILQALNAAQANSRVVTHWIHT